MMIGTRLHKWFSLFHSNYSLKSRSNHHAASSQHHPKQGSCYPERMRGISPRFKLLALVIVIIVVLLDQLSKAWISQYLSLTESKNVFPGFDLILRHNTGAAFSF